MLTIEECRNYLKNYNLTDKEVEEIRNTLYCVAENIINNYVQNVENNN